MNAKLLDLQRRANHERKYDAYIEDDGPAVTALTEFLATRLQAVADATMVSLMLRVARAKRAGTDTMSRSNV